MKKWLTLLITMCLVCSVLAGCTQSEASQRTAQVIRGDLIIIAPVEEGNLEISHKEYLAFGTTGEVDEILVEEGDTVAEGQVLARLDTRTLELKVGTAQAICQMAQAKREMAQNNLMQTIYPHYTKTRGTDMPGVWLALEEVQSNLEEAQKLLAQDKVEEAQALLDLIAQSASKAERKSQARAWVLPPSVKLAELQLDEATAALDTAELELAIVMLELAKATITAPFDGIIAAIYIDEGQQLSAMTYTSPAIHLVDPGEVKMNGDIDEVDIFNVEPGQEAIVTLDALPDEKMKGKVTFVSPTGEVWEDEVSYRTTITLENHSEDLKDGMTASADIIIDRRDNTLLIPDRVIQGSPENAWVEVVTSDSTERRQVTLGLSDGTYTEVLFGLKEGEKVVLP